MLFAQKPVSMSIGEFMQQGRNVKLEMQIEKELKKIWDELKKKKYQFGAATTVMAGVTLTNRMIAHAQAVEVVPVASIADAIQGKVIHAFDPLMKLLIALSYPVAGVMLSFGCLLIMINQKDKGLGMIQMAGIGYILVQLSPLFMNLLVEVGKMN